MAIETYQFLNEAGVQKLAEQLLGKVNVRIGERIVTSVSENSSDKQVASAKALYTLISALQSKDTELAGRLDGHDTQIGNNATAIGELQSAQGEQGTAIADLESDLATLTQTVESLTHITMETVEGDISTVTEPKTDVMYLQRDNADDKTWMIYIYQNGSWINVGDTEVDLSNYWTKDSIEEMKVALGMHNAEAITDEKISAAVEAAFASTAVELA
jgi:hypothetical protein